MIVYVISKIERHAGFEIIFECRDYTDLKDFKNATLSIVTPHKSVFDSYAIGNKYELLLKSLA